MVQSPARSSFSTAILIRPIQRPVRSMGLLAGVELHRGAAPGQRGTEAQKRMFWNGLHVKFTGDTGILAPMFIATTAHIDEMLDKFRTTLNSLA